MEEDESGHNSWDLFVEYGSLGSGAVRPRCARICGTTGRRTSVSRTAESALRLRGPTTCLNVATARYPAHAAFSPCCRAGTRFSESSIAITPAAPASQEQEKDRSLLESPSRGESLARQFWRFSESDGSGIGEYQFDEKLRDVATLPAAQEGCSQRRIGGALDTTCGRRDL